MKKCMCCGKVMQTNEVKYMEKLATTKKVEVGTYLCMICQVSEGINSFEKFDWVNKAILDKKNIVITNRKKEEQQMIKFNLQQGEIIRKVQYTKEDGELAMKHAIYSFLKVLDYEGLLAKGYLTRVKNGSISLSAVQKMVNSKAEQSAYRLESLKHNNIYYVALVQKIKQ